jgi:hypothetical protein
MDLIFLFIGLTTCGIVLIGSGGRVGIHAWQGNFMGMYIPVALPAPMVTSETRPHAPVSPPEFQNGLP